MDSKTTRENAKEAAIRKLGNFCSSYTLRKSDELLSHSLTTLIAGNYASLSNLSKEHLQDYFEALEEVLPVLYELQKHLEKPRGF